MKIQAKTCGLDTIGLLIKEPQTMGREISKRGDLGHRSSHLQLCVSLALSLLLSLVSVISVPGYSEYLR